MRFQDLIEELEVDSFEQKSRQIMRRLDAGGTSVQFHFPRGQAPSSRDSNALAMYRREVAIIPKMEREDEIRFCMGVEFLWRRLQKARRAAGFSKTEIEVYPGTENVNCSSCPPGRELVCMGCAPLDLSQELRQRLRARTSEFVIARNELMERHLYIVFRLLQRYRYSGVPVEDLIQEANFSLFKAVRGFDFTRGVRFKTYAGYWVNQAFLTAIYNQSRTVRVPAYIQKAMKKINDASNGQVAGVHDVVAVSKDSGVSEDLVRNALVGNRYTLSLNRAVDEDGSQMVDLVEGEDAARPPEFQEQARLSNHLEQAVARLSSREQLVLRSRFGLGENAPGTLAEVGSRLGISLERVRQIQKAALEKIRNSDGGRLLSEYA
jgi:RNA polymerase primary sigma factor